MKSKYMILLMISLLIFSGCGKKEENNEVKKEVVLNVSVLPIKYTSIKPEINLTGWVEPYIDINISSELGGEVEKIYKKEGKYIKKDELIISFNKEIVKASHDQAKASFELAKSNYQRQKTLFDKKLISQSVIDNLEANLKIAEANFNASNVQLKKKEIISPINGIINSLDADIGEVIMPAQPIGKIIDISKVYIRVSFPEKDILDIKEKDEVKIKLNSKSDKLYKGSIEFIAKASYSVSKTFKVKVLVNNDEEILRPGMIVNAIFSKPLMKDIIKIPQTAIFSKDGRKWVFVAVDGKSIEKEIKTGAVVEDNVEVRSGLKLNDNLIVIGQHNLIDGDKIKIVKNPF